MTWRIRTAVCSWLALVLALAAGCGERSILISGWAQGTSYHITVVPDDTTQGQAALRAAIEQRLAQLDRALSAYRGDSELNAFNRAPAGEWLAVGKDLYAVLALAAEISAQSDGAFDITVAPLAHLWGFGPDRGFDRFPPQAAIDAARVQVDYHQLLIDTQQQRIRKLRPLTVDIDGIAQGYSVDQLAAVLEGADARRYLVELGGELRMAGRGPHGGLWRVGIEKPGIGFSGALQAIVGTDIAVSTAGDYRDFFERDSHRYSHTIDPASGRPVQHALASVTVVAPSAAAADGFDTALAVLGPERGLALAERLQLPAYFIVRGPDGFSVRYSAAMRGYLPRE